jgi:hypothetical protein
VPLPGLACVDLRKPAVRKEEVARRRWMAGKRVRLRDWMVKGEKGRDVKGGKGRDGKGKGEEGGGLEGLLRAFGVEEEGSVNCGQGVSSRLQRSMNDAKSHGEEAHDVESLPKDR